MLSLMIVDDDDDDRFLFKLAVQQMRPYYEYCQAHSGNQALQYLRRAQKLPEFIFLDINMPLMSGVECLKELKTDERLKRIPVIMYTTSNYGKDIQACLNLGAVYYLHKPSNVSRLAEEIHIAIRRAKEFGPDRTQSL